MKITDITDITQKGFDYVFSLFDDEESKELFSSIVTYRKTANLSCLLEFDKTTQYFPDFLIDTIDMSHFVDCGAFTGDTVKDAHKIFGNKLSHISCFEPVLNNFAALSAYIKKEQIAGTVDLFLNSVWSCCTIKQIIPMQQASRISTEAQKNFLITQNTICVDLDSVFKTIPVSYIKMDIEGSEIEALKGALFLIKKHRPSLAISVYHKPLDFFEIPYLLDSWRLDYSFFLRCYGPQTFETILYAIPKERL